MADVKAQVDELKNKGNKFLKENKVDEAVKCYTDAISLDGSNHIIYSNRSAAYCTAKKYEEALGDAEMVIGIKPDWAKGYSRKGAALASMSRHEEALMTYMEGLDRDPTNEQLKEGAKDAKQKLTGPAGSQPLVNPFADKDLWSKLENDSRTKDFSHDAEFKSMIETISKDPKQLGKHMQDIRIMTALGVLLGVDLSMGDSEDNPTNGWPTDSGDMPAPPPEKNPTPPPEKKSKEQSSKSAEPNLSNNQKEAAQEKEKGNAAYKKKEFEEALTHYGKAIELDPTNIIYRNNRAAVYFEQTKYDECIKECEQAVEVGRDNRADYKLLAKAFSRIGNAYYKLEDLKQTVVYYNKSLSEHRDPDLVKKTLQIEKQIKERERLAYVDPEKSLEEKQLGNECFQKGDYPTALKHYTEAIKRNPDDAKIYSNRAACYTKLAEFNMALKDSDDCIRLDPKFVKGYLRKGATLIALKQTSKAADVYQRALEIDPNCQEAVEGYRKCMMQDGDPEVVKRRAMQDPEVQQILSDPAMQLILQQMQKDPKALQEHLRNPDIAKKIEKLMEVGLIAIR